MKDWRTFTLADWVRLVDEAAVLCDRLVDMLPIGTRDGWDKWDRITNAAFARLSRREMALWAKQDEAARNV